MSGSSKRFTVAGALVVVAALGGCAAGGAVDGRSELLVFVGGNAGVEEEGIRLFGLDPESGALTARGSATGVRHPTFLDVTADGRHLYATSEIDDFGGGKTGAVAAFEVDPVAGRMTLLGLQPSGGTGPCHLSLDRAGRRLLVACYGGGSIACLPVLEDGRLGPPTTVVQHRGSGADPKRQAGPHPHNIRLDAGERFVLVADLGLDRIFAYRLEEGVGTFAPNEPAAVAAAPGSGPRHLAVDPRGGFVYAGNELANTVTVYRYAADLGTLEAIQDVPTLPAGFAEPSHVGEVRLSPDGRRLYVSNRGHDSLATFAVDPESGRLVRIGHVPCGGKLPWHFDVDPTGRWMVVANWGSDAVVVLGIDPVTGLPSPVGPGVRVPKPRCIKILAPATSR